MNGETGTHVVSDIECAYAVLVMRLSGLLRLRSD